MCITAMVLKANRRKVVIFRTQVCCVLLPEHQRQEKPAQVLVKQIINSLEKIDFDYIIINSAGCSNSLKEEWLYLERLSKVLKKGYSIIIG